MEKLLTTQDLAAIILEAEQNNGQYLRGLFISGEATATTIFTISAYKQLIFVEGNEDTGYRHFKDRHSFFSLENYWRSNDDGELKLDDPSKFNPKMMPVIDYIKISDALYRAENENTIKNKRPDTFDLYTGFYSFSGEQPEKYHLLTYKGTKIVHTLFPDKQKHKPKNKLKYAKGLVKMELDVIAAINDLVVPYENSAGVPVYSILIRKFYPEKIERTFIQSHDENGIVDGLYLLDQRTFEQFEQFEMTDIMRFQHSDLRDYEAIFSKIDAENNAK